MAGTLTNTGNLGIYATRAAVAEVTANSFVNGGTVD